MSCIMAGAAGFEPAKMRRSKRRELSPFSTRQYDKSVRVPPRPMTELIKSVYFRSCIAF